ALALRQAGFEVAIYDRVPVLSAVGAGISLWSNGVKVLDRLGLGHGLAAIGGRMERICYRSKSGEVLTDFSLEPLLAAVGERPYPVARADLQQLLLDAVGPSSVRLGHECVGVEQDASSASAIFSDGSRARGDMVLAADGTHSVLRSTVLGQTPARRFVGYTNYNGLVPCGPSLPPANTWTTFVGEHKRAALMPVGGQRFYFFFDLPGSEPSRTPPSEARRELEQHFAGWAEPVQALIAQLDPARINRIPIHDFDPLPRFVQGRVALLGDAAHTSPPDLGQGGCQAMEDAWMLAHVLLTTNLGVPDALTRYERARLERTADIVLRARKRSDVTHGKDPEKTAAWYRELASEDGSSIMNALVRTIEGGPMG
ncbi:MAG TPA: FAD-dependent urate hydroxylase HpxO, partial [Polyangiaceae bacterium]|nr:FAD-dependent urate hydroxylase HpxO [Polyangiaceae bacterium]